MTTITEIRRNNKLTGFEVSGHADYAPYGQDIVCASVSVLTINTINSIVSVAKSGVTIQNEDGYVKYVAIDTNDRALTLLESASLGYQSIAGQYPNYVKYVATSHEGR